ncbi:MAG: hypothetical protein QXK12_04940 [Candidatus Nezhaarchaeales archaeon]
MAGLEPVYGRLVTTVIGSFPLPFSEANMGRVLADQVEAGVDYPCYGQLIDMCRMFLEPLAVQGCGISMVNGTPWLTGDLTPPSKPVALEYLVFAKRWLKEYGFEDRVKGVKVPVTGPLTLASVTKITDKHYAIEYPDIVERFSMVVAEIVKQYDEAGADLITVDEPTIPYAFHLGLDEDLLIKAVDKPIEAVRKAIPSLHCCGDVKGLSWFFLKLKAPILSHAFKAYPKNLEAYSKTELEKADKMVGLGCIDTNPDPKLLLEVAKGKRNWLSVAEGVDEVEAFIHEGGKRFGYERLLIHPDCGFGGLKEYFNDDTGHRIAMEKLKRMVEATKRVKGSFLQPLKR